MFSLTTVCSTVGTPVVCTSYHMLRTERRDKVTDDPTTSPRLIIHRVRLRVDFTTSVLPYTDILVLYCTTVLVVLVLSVSLTPRSEHRMLANI